MIGQPMSAAERRVLTADAQRVREQNTTIVLPPSETERRILEELYCECLHRADEAALESCRVHGIGRDAALYDERLWVARAAVVGKQLGIGAA